MKAIFLLRFLLVLFALLQSTSAQNSTEPIKISFLRPSIAEFSILSGGATAFLNLIVLNMTKEIQPV